MTVLAVAVFVIALMGMIGTGVVLFAHTRRDKRREAREIAVAKVAQEYLARYKIRGRTIAATLPDESIALMVETPPHKKLRFSYIIEQPIKNFIRLHTGVEVARIFWRFPLPPRPSQTAEIQYADPSTIQLDAGEESTTVVTPAPASPPPESDDDEDEYFQHQSYHIEEVSWEDFSTVSGGDAPDHVSEPVKK